MPATFILDGKGRIRFVHEPEKNKDPAELIAHEIAQLTDESVPADTKTEVAGATPAATQRVALAVAVSEPSPVTPAAPATSSTAATEETSAAPPSDAAQAPKSRAKPSAGKKGVAKKPKKKSAVPADNAAKS
jgi:hypothetical protein